jgi:hypothetical protein
MNELILRPDRFNHVVLAGLLGLNGVGTADLGQAVNMRRLEAETLREDNTPLVFVEVLPTTAGGSPSILGSRDDLPNQASEVTVITGRIGTISKPHNH